MTTLELVKSRIESVNKNTNTTKEKDKENEDKS